MKILNIINDLFQFFGKNIFSSVYQPKVLLSLLTFWISLNVVRKWLQICYTMHIFWHKMTRFSYLEHCNCLLALELIIVGMISKGFFFILFQQHLVIYVNLVPMFPEFYNVISVFWFKNLQTLCGKFGLSLYFIVKWRIIFWLKLWVFAYFLENTQLRAFSFCS